MTNKIMELVQRYAYESRWNCDEVSHVTAVALATEVQAHIDYTRAVISERDALRKVAQMAMEALDYSDIAVLVYPEGEFHTNALRKELEQ